LKEFGVGLPAPPEPFGTARLIVAKHERSHEMFYLGRVKPGFSRDPERPCAEPRFRHRMQSSVDGILR
jgi:hypothetical protein